MCVEQERPALLSGNNGGLRTCDLTVFERGYVVSADRFYHQTHSRHNSAYPSQYSCAQPVHDSSRSLAKTFEDYPVNNNSNNGGYAKVVDWDDSSPE
jgi:hypothetical protein